MTAFLLVIHVCVAAALVGTILLQRSDGGALGGIGGGSDPFGGVMSSRGSANLLTRTTAVLAVAFMGISLLLAVLASIPDDDPLSVVPITEETLPDGILETRDRRGRLRAGAADGRVTTFAVASIPVPRRASPGPA